MPQGGPGRRLDRERLLGQQAAAPRAYPVPDVRCEGSQVVTGRADAELERVPPLLEAGEGDPYRQAPAPGGQAGRARRGRRADPRRARAQVGLADDGRVEVAGRPPERRQRAVRSPARSHTLRATVPPGAVTRAISARPADRVAHEVHDELGEHEVERRVVERQLLGRCASRRRHPGSATAAAHERRGRVDRGHDGPGRAGRPARRSARPGRTRRRARAARAVPRGSTNSAASGLEKRPMNRP